MVLVNQGIGTSVPEKVEKGGDTWCFLSMVGMGWGGGLNGLNGEGGINIEGGGGGLTPWKTPNS